MNSNPDLTVHEVKRQPWMTDTDYAWAQREEISRVNTAKRYYGDGQEALIAIKAQDPLNPDGTPGLEYTERLTTAANLIDILVEMGINYTVMTFGGVHAGSDVTLAESGAKWLEENGVPPECIIVNDKVYSGNDEDDLAIQEFANNPKYNQLHIFLSAGQYDRTRFYCISTGWQPFLQPIVFFDAPPRHSSLCEFSGKYGSSAYSMVNNGLEKIHEATLAARKRHEDDLAAFRTQQAEPPQDDGDQPNQPEPGNCCAPPAGD